MACAHSFLHLHALWLPLFCCCVTPSQLFHPKPVQRLLLSTPMHAMPFALWTELGPFVHPTHPHAVCATLPLCFPTR